MNITFMLKMPWWLKCQRCKTAAGQLQKALKDVKGSAKAIEAAETCQGLDLTEHR